MDPISITALGAMAFSGFVGNFADRKACELIGKVQRDLGAGLKEPRNHDLSRAIRRSQLLALKLTIKAYEKLDHPSPLSFPGYSPEDITRPLSIWIDANLKHDSTLESALSGLVSEDRKVFNERLSAMENRISQVFMRPPLHDGSSAERMIKMRKLCEDWMIEDAQNQLNLGKDWLRFEGLFRSDDTGNFSGWWRLFCACLAEEIKNDPKVNAILVQQELAQTLELQTDILNALGELQSGLDVYMADIRAGLGELQQTIEQVESKIDVVFENQCAQNEKLDAVLAQLKAQGLVYKVAQQGIPIERLRQIVEDLGGAGVANEDLPQWLEGWIADVRARLSSIHDEGAAFDGALAETRRRFLAGEKNIVTVPLTQLLENERLESKQRQLRIIEEAIEYEKLSLNFCKAADFIEEKIKIENINSDLNIRNLWIECERWHKRGSDKGVNIDLSIAIELANRAVNISPSNFEKAVSLNLLGNSLSVLGERESPLGSLDTAVVAYQDALTIFKAMGSKLDVAGTKSGLANVLRAIGEREVGIESFEKSLRLLQEALSETSLVTRPIVWAMAQNNIGIILSCLYEQRNIKGSIHEAVSAFYQALKVLTAEDNALEWGMVQNNLGLALIQQGNISNNEELYILAVEAFDAALQVRTREFPIYWAMSQNNKGIALCKLGELRNNFSKIEEAASCFQLALEERHRDRVPLGWAMSQNNIGNAFSSLARRRKSKKYFQAAITAYQCALEERTKKTLPLEWAATVINLSDVKAAMGEWCGNSSMVLQAHNELSEAMDLAISLNATSLLLNACEALMRIENIRIRMKLG